MNSIRRKAIRACESKIKHQLELLQQLQEEESEAYHNMPENLQYSEKGEKVEQCADDLQGLIDNIEAELEELDTILE